MSLTPNELDRLVVCVCVCVTVESLCVCVTVESLCVCVCRQITPHAQHEWGKVIGLDMLVDKIFF